MQGVFQAGRREIHKRLRKSEDEADPHYPNCIAGKEADHEPGCAYAQNHIKKDRTVVDISAEKVDGRKQKQPERMRKSLHPLCDVPSESVSIDTVIDATEGDLCVVTHPRGIHDAQSKQEETCRSDIPGPGIVIGDVG